MTAIATPTPVTETAAAPATKVVKKTVTAKKTSPAKKASAAKKASPAKKASVAKKASPAKKASAAKKTRPAQKASTVKAVKTASAAPASGKPNAKAQAPQDAGKDKKLKVIRDSFTIPKNEFTQIGDMKKRAMALGLDVKKSELIRSGLMALSGMTDTSFKKALANVPTLKTGRPGKN